MARAVMRAMPAAGRLPAAAPLLAACGLLAGAVCCARAQTVVITTNGSTVIVNGHVVSGNGNVTLAKGPIRTEQRALAPYSGMRVDAPAEVTFSPSERSAVTITAPSDILPLIETDVSDGTLVIALKGSVVLSSPIVIAATGPGLGAIALAGSGSVKAAGLSGPALDISLAGSGVVAATGNVERISIRLTGSGDVDVAAIRAAEVRGLIAGSGTIRAFARESVAARITGSGAFFVSGDPPHRASSVTGSGEILFR
jgi:hypothetical protein